MDFSEQAKDRLIFALDVPNLQEAVHYVKMLDGLVGCFKVGLELFVREGPDVLKAVSENSSAGIFLDLKLHDIPATVRGALRSVSGHGVRFVTVHAGDGETMLESAKEVCSNGLEVLAVTVLTSVSEKDLSRLGYREGLTLRQLVLDRASMAKKSGCAGVVCSGEEISAVRKLCGADFKVVVPGIRPQWSVVDKDDQKRITTPADAIAQGADCIVVGRPIRTAKDPKEAARKILREIDST